jgi:hypothetical protein
VTEITGTIPADVLEQLQDAAAAEGTAVAIAESAESMYDHRVHEAEEAEAAVERARDNADSAHRKAKQAHIRLMALQEASGVVRTADGFRIKGSI